MPLHIFEGLSGKLITNILRPGRWNKQAKISKLLQKLISYLRVQWPETKITVTCLTDFRTCDLYRKVTVPWVL